MNILGIGGYSHDSAAALVCDGELVAAVAEERLTRVKHQGGPPRNAVAFCLEHAGLTINDIDHIGCYMRPMERITKRIKYRPTQLPNSIQYSLAYMAYELYHNTRYIQDMRSLRGTNTQLHYMSHHPAHAASAFLVSPYDEAAILSIDYVGEIASTWAGVGQGTDIQPLYTIDYPQSLGVFYSAITDYLGFLRASDEYKVMGLASYGEPDYIDTFRDIIRTTDNGRYVIDLSWMQSHYLPGSRFGYFSDKFIEQFGPRRKKDEPIEDRHKAIAASAQTVLEEVALHMTKHLHAQTGSKRLCMAGGVVLNCAMNGVLLRESPFDEIWVQPAAGDDGIAIGAAFQLHHQRTGSDRAFTMRHAHYGPSFSNETIQNALESAGVSYETPDNLTETAADLIADGLIVGWYQGAMEFGPRALGSRSILADPTRPDMQDKLNTQVKHREEFRPFAPSVLRERAGEFFEGCTDSPYMLFVYPVRADAQSKFPAITHVDGTARVQTVDRETHPRYYALIEAFEKRRGVPVVVNTSFNVMGEPIVNTPEDAIRCFQGTGIDALAIGDYVVRK